MKNRNKKRKELHSLPDQLLDKTAFLIWGEALRGLCDGWHTHTRCVFVLVCADVNGMITIPLKVRHQKWVGGFFKCSLSRVFVSLSSPVYILTSWILPLKSWMHHNYSTVGSNTPDAVTIYNSFIHSVVYPSWSVFQTFKLWGPSWGARYIYLIPFYFWHEWNPQPFPKEV